MYVSAMRTGKKILPVVQTRHILDVDGAILRALPAYRDRKILYSRLNQYLNGPRRGRLRLPANFPPEVRRLSDMSKAHIRRSQFWVKPKTEFFHRLPRSAEKYLRQMAPGKIWTSMGNVPIQKANSVAVKRLNKSYVPRVSRSSWPSCPSFSEMMYMSRSGIGNPVHDNFRNLKVRNHLVPRDIHDNRDLATRIVRRQIVGIRYEMEVPRKFLKYFRYRDGFLILSVRHCLPIGLVRFLLSQWITCFTSLWLVEPVRFKIFLKRHVSSDFVRKPVRVDTVSDCDDLILELKGKLESESPEFDSEDSDQEFLQAMRHRFGGDPALI